MRHRSLPGFTLVELLVTISVIAVLMAILMPFVRRAREQARMAVCKANLRSLSTAIHIYANNNDGKLVPGDHGMSWAVWAVASEATYGDSNNYQPVNLGHLLDTEALPTPHDNDSVLFCPSNRLPDMSQPGEGFKDYWGVEGATAITSYMYNTSLDGTGEYLQSGLWPVSAHNDRIDYVMADGSVQTFRVPRLLYDEKIGPELIHEVCSRHGLSFPTSLLFSWLEQDEINLTEAQEFLANPNDWLTENQIASSLKPTLLSKVGQRALACDVVGAWDGMEPTEQASGGG